MTKNQVSRLFGVTESHIVKVSDIRGSFSKLDPREDLSCELESIAISQNSEVGTLRGLHLQIGTFQEEKIVTCIQGAVFDVLVDLRPKSPTLGKWMGLEINTGNMIKLFIPRGVAHGFQTLKPDSTLLYAISGKYKPESSITLNPFCELEIGWPMEVTSISDKDRHGISLSDALTKFASNQE